MRGITKERTALEYCIKLKYGIFTVRTHTKRPGKSLDCEKFFKTTIFLLQFHRLAEYKIRHEPTYTCDFRRRVDILQEPQGIDFCLIRVCLYNHVRELGQPHKSEKKITVFEYCF